MSVRTFDEFFNDTKAYLLRFREFAKYKKAYEDKWERADSLTDAATDEQKAEFEGLIRELDKIVEEMKS